MSDGTYTIPFEDYNDEIIKLFDNSDWPKLEKKKKKKEKKEKEKMKIFKKIMDSILEPNKKGKGKSKKKKHAKGKLMKSKSKKQAWLELMLRLIEMVADTTLDTTSYGFKRFFDHKLPVDNSKKKIK